MFEILTSELFEMFQMRGGRKEEEEEEEVEMVMEVEENMKYLHYYRKNNDVESAELKRV